VIFFWNFIIDYSFCSYSSIFILCGNPPNWIFPPSDSGITYNDWQVHELPSGETIHWYRYWRGRNLGGGRQAESL